MDDLKKRYLWETQCDVAAAAARAEQAQRTHDDAVAKLARLEEQFETDIRGRYMTPTQMPAAGTEFFHIKRDLISAEVMNPAAGIVITFIVNAAGPELMGDDGSIVRNMHVDSTRPVTDSVPLYPNGATLKYYYWNHKRTLEIPNQSLVELDHASFDNVGNNNTALSVVKSPEINPIDKNNCFSEGLLEYRIISTAGFPIAIRRITAMTGNQPQFYRLCRIRGQVVKIEPICSGGDFVIPLSAMLVPSVETKSAARRQ